MLVFNPKRPFSAISASNFTFSCAAYNSTPQRKCLFSLTLRKISRFGIENASSPILSFGMGTMLEIPGAFASCLS